MEWSLLLPVTFTGDNCMVSAFTCDFCWGQLHGLCFYLLLLLGTIEWSLLLPVTFAGDIGMVSAISCDFYWGQLNGLCFYL